MENLILALVTIVTFAFFLCVIDAKRKKPKIGRDL